MRHTRYVVENVKRGSGQHLEQLSVVSIWNSCQSSRTLVVRTNAEHIKRALDQRVPLTGAPPAQPCPWPERADNGALMSCTIVSPLRRARTGSVGIVVGEGSGPTMAHRCRAPLSATGTGSVGDVVGEGTVGSKTPLHLSKFFIQHPAP